MTIDLVNARTLASAHSVYCGRKHVDGHTRNTDCTCGFSRFAEEMNGLCDEVEALRSDRDKLASWNDRLLEEREEARRYAVALLASCVSRDAGGGGRPLAEAKAAKDIERWDAEKEGGT